MDDNYNCDRPKSFGFQILARKMRLKLDLDAQGHEGLVSLIIACIASGINWDYAINEEVCGVTGQHLDEQISLILEEGRDVYWHKSRDGTFGLMHP